MKIDKQTKTPVQRLKKSADEIRSEKMTCRFSKIELELFEKLSKKLDISRIELFVRSVKMYNEYIENEVNKNQMKLDI
jgi:hypothetical protein